MPPRTRRAARAAAERLLLELPTDVLSLVLYQLPLAHDIALAGLTCRQLCDAAKLALKLRPFSNMVMTLAGHTRSLQAVAAVPDGRIITGGYDGAVKVWRDGRCECTIQNTVEVEFLAILPGGERYVIVADNGTATIWTIDGDHEHTFRVSDRNVWHVAALPDGVHFVAALHNGDVGLYHVDEMLVHTFKGHTSDVMAVAVTRDGQHIISGSGDHLVKVWSIASKSLVRTCVGHAGYVRAVAAMPDSQRILSGSDDGEVRVWLLDGTLENTFSGLHVRYVVALVALPDNQHALSGACDFAVKLFNVNDGIVLRAFSIHTRAVTSLALLPDGLRFVSCSDDMTACVIEHGLAPQTLQ